MGISTFTDPPLYSTFVFSFNSALPLLNVTIKTFPQSRVLRGDTSGTILSVANIV